MAADLGTDELRIDRIQHVARALCPRTSAGRWAPRSYWRYGVRPRRGNRTDHATRPGGLDGETRADTLGGNRSGGLRDAVFSKQSNAWRYTVLRGRVTRVPRTVAGVSVSIEPRQEHVPLITKTRRTRRTRRALYQKEPS